MIRSIVFAISGNAISGNEGTARERACETGLKQFQGRCRVLVIFADKAHTQAAHQKTLLATASDGLVERDVVVLLAKNHMVTAILGEAEPVDYDMLRTRLSGPDTGRFMAVLVGKDGMVKLREREAVTPDELFAVIDSMPSDTAARAG